MFLDSLKSTIINSSKGYSEPVKLSDVEGIGYRKLRKQDGKDFVSIYKIYFDKKFSDTGRQPITISVSYGELKEDKSIVISPTSIPRKFSWPIDFYSKDEFYFDKKSGKIFQNSKELNLSEFVNVIDTIHTKPTLFFRGFLLRMRLIFWRKIATNFFLYLYNVLVFILFIFSGTKTISSIWSAEVSVNEKGAKLKTNKTKFSSEKINLFGYAASAWSVVVYAIFHFTAFTIWYFYSGQVFPYLHFVFSNTFLTISYVVPTVVFFERIIPSVLESMIIILRNKYQRTSFKQVSL